MNYATVLILMHREYMVPVDLIVTTANDQTAVDLTKPLLQQPESTVTEPEASVSLSAFRHYSTGTITPSHSIPTCTQPLGLTASIFCPSSAALDPTRPLTAVAPEAIAAEEPGPSSSSTRPRLHRSHALSEQLSACTSAKNGSVATVAAQYNVHTKTVREWLKKEDQLRQQVDGQHPDQPVFVHSPRRRLPGGGRKPISVELDKVLFEWLLEQKSNRIQVSVNEFKDKATRVFRELQTDGKINGAVTFSASRGWLWRFSSRFNIGLCRCPEQCLAGTGNCPYRICMRSARRGRCPSRNVVTSTGHREDGPSTSRDHGYHK